MIEPRHIIQALQTIDGNTPLETFIRGLFDQLPRCVQRAIGTLQCTQLEPEYKALRTRLMAEFGFDLHQHIRAEIERILKRPR
jgi:hypothetical protein